jgi:A/G-specific adenine glycosylase
MSYFSDALLAWFKKNGRKTLPWQKKQTPYRVWVSEIMLQQTQVTTVIPYYQRFMSHFPSIASLARASQDDVLAHWAGLGYYSRARNLHKAASRIMTEHGGRFPSDINKVIRLPGIGPSTAGAILAFSKGQRHAILDGNVKRVLTRFHIIPGVPARAHVNQQLWDMADHHTPHENVGDYTQAIMDLGATLCTRTLPACHHCPVATQCEAHRTGRTQEFPHKKPKKLKPVKHQYFLVLLMNQTILLEKRPDSGIWGGLWSLPELDTNNLVQIAALCRQRFGVTISAITPGQAFQHTFSHYQLNASPLIATVTRTLQNTGDKPTFAWYHPLQNKKLGLPAPINHYLKTL